MKLHWRQKDRTKTVSRSNKTADRLAFKYKYYCAFADSRALEAASTPDSSRLEAASAADSAKYVS